MANSLISAKELETGRDLHYSVDGVDWSPSIRIEKYLLARLHWMDDRPRELDESLEKTSFMPGCRGVGLLFKNPNGLEGFHSKPIWSYRTLVRIPMLPIC